MDIKDFQHDDWVQIWAGAFSFLSVSNYGHGFTKRFEYDGRHLFSRVAIFHEQGQSACWVRQAEKDTLGEGLARELMATDDGGLSLGVDFEQQADKMLQLIDQSISTELTLISYKKFWDGVWSYYQPHVRAKYVVDYLSPEDLKKVLPNLERARVYAEPVFSRVEDFVMYVAKTVSKATGLPPELVTCASHGELLSYLVEQAMPAEEVLSARQEKSALLFTSHDEAFLVGAEAGEALAVVARAEVEGELRGSVAFEGSATGTVRIVPDPKNPGKFNEGDVLVASSTRPEYLPLMKKAAAFVTDSGGVLSHAAIVAREMEKPCVIGTKVATKVLKNGDRVEVDAVEGVIKKV